MMHLIWLTDIHLNFLNKDRRTDFYKKLADSQGDKILISGDIAVANSVANLLTEMATAVNKPIYFVLGNHDYYYGDVNSVREEMLTLTQNEPLLHWLPAAGPQNLGEGTFLLGEDTWADGRYGDYVQSRIVLNDSRMIADLFQSSILGKYQLLDKMQQLADRDASQLKQSLIATINDHRPQKVIVLVHVPPFQEACLYEGKMTDDDHLPFFSSKATGDVLMQVAQENPEIQFTVLCGHTHHKAHWQPLENLVVKVGAAEYADPEIQEVIEL